MIGDATGLVELLCRAHGSFGAEPVAFVGFLLERGGGERRWRVFDVGALREVGTIRVGR